MKLNMKELCGRHQLTRLPGALSCPWGMKWRSAVSYHHPDPTTDHSLLMFSPKKKLDLDLAPDTSWELPSFLLVLHQISIVNQK